MLKKVNKSLIKQQIFIAIVLGVNIVYFSYNLVRLVWKGWSFFISGVSYQDKIQILSFPRGSSHIQCIFFIWKWDYVLIWGRWFTGMIQGKLSNDWCSLSVKWFYFFFFSKSLASERALPIKPAGMVTTPTPMISTKKVKILPPIVIG